MAEVVLWHLEFSNYNEKARWALDLKRVPHVRRTPPPGLHAPVAKLLTGGGSQTFPVLEIGGRVIGDSTRIIEELERLHPEPALYPENPDERRRALELEDYFDEHYGHEVRRVVFWNLLRDPESAESALHLLSPPAAIPVMRRLGPLLRGRLFAYYGVDEETAARGLDLIRAGFDRIEAERAGGDYLVGDSFTVADLTAAALVAPLLSPPEMPYQPSSGPPAPLAAVREELDAHPAASWLRDVYARHRHAGAATPAGA